MEDAARLFYRWYVHPLKVLGELPNGDGGFIALAISCSLYERYAVAVIKESGGTADDGAIRAQFAKDFDVDEDTARAFWNVIRNGLLHGAMPKQRERGNKALPRWAFRHDYPAVELSEWDGNPVLRVQPWKITDKVIVLWRENLHLLGQSEGFPWANIGHLPI